MAEAAIEGVPSHLCHGFSEEIFLEASSSCLSAASTIRRPDNIFLYGAFMDLRSFACTHMLLPDYESEAWTFKCQIKLPIMEISAKCENHDDDSDVVVVPSDGKLLVLVKFSKWLIQVDVDNKVVKTFQINENVYLNTQSCIKKVLHYAIITLYY
uniref:F-box associated domain-containing protein n=1 Tax=Aegilops tauschii TaxID=37682 RepID=N1R258_AEGTA